MYYKSMKASVLLKEELKILGNRKKLSQSERVETSSITLDTKFYQKLLVVLISLSTILIFPESPKMLENICERNYSSNICNVW